jgi:hypothetical protein
MRHLGQLMREHAFLLLQLVQVLLRLQQPIFARSLAL